MTNQPQRVKIEQHNGITVYSASAWPGRRDIGATCFGFVVILGIFSIFLFLTYNVARMFDNLTPYGWLNWLLVSLFSGGFAVGWTLMLGFILLWIPYWLVYQLSPKQFRIENNCLIHRVHLAGLLPRTRRIPFERIMDITIEHSGTKNHRVWLLNVRYEMKLPKWLFIVLVHWNEKFTQWPLALVNGIGTREEAEALQTALLEPMTASPACRIGMNAPEKVLSGFCL